MTPNPNDIAQALSKHQAIELAIVFGSIARGTEHNESDLDIAVAAKAPLTANEKMQLIGDLAVAFGRPVDLVDLSTAGEPLLGQILVHGKRILGDDTRFARLLYKHLLDEADFMPYQRRILEERRRAWIGN